ncbi:MAG TPA: hypothetical protein PK020_13135 [Ilumatobacteraceae bacterium]|nr:hypothetical protein [Ilumatobacteraceae bacterium]HRB03102.1 hypothetical protein [Ilumatobacteraceae bacterium]
MSRARRITVTDDGATATIETLELQWVREQFRPNPDVVKMDDLQRQIDALKAAQ